MARLAAIDGLGNGELAEVTGFSTQHVSRIFSDPLFIEEVERIRNKLELHSIKHVDAARQLIYDKATDLIANLIKIAENGSSDAVRERAIAQAMSYIMQKKNDLPQDNDNRPYLAVQLADHAKLDADPDVNPAANSNIVKLVMPKAAEVS